MSWLLFMDESGHDRRTMPGEVRGGVAIHAGKVWPFVQAWHRAELEVFGVRLADFGKEIKGHKLLDKDRFKWAGQAEMMEDAARHKGVRRFLTLSQEKKPLRRDDFTAYGQASLAMARRILSLLRTYDAQVFASFIPKSARPPDGYELHHLLRKDHVFLLANFHHFLDERREHGLLVMDETDRTDDKRFVRRLHDYFIRTQAGRERANWIVPEPLFVSSDMTVGVQAADLVLYCINQGFRPNTWGFDGPSREEVGRLSARDLFDLQYSGEGYRDGQPFVVKGIAYVPDPYERRNKKGGKTDGTTS